MRIKFLLPFGIFLLLTFFLFKGLYLDPRSLPSALLDKPMPAWTLPELFTPEKTFSSQSMRGKVWVLNVWATWCQPCKQEHPVLLQLKRDGLKVPLVGLIYRDQATSADQWLRDEGNPYDIVVMEPTASATLDMGVTGVPETFIVDKNGTIRRRISGAITPSRWAEEVEPLLKELEAQPYNAESAPKAASQS